MAPSASSSTLSGSIRATVAWYSTLGALKLSRGRNEEAETAFRKAIELDPTSAKPHIALGYYLWAVRRVPEAEAAFTRALALDPQSSLVNRILATLFLTTNRAGQVEPYLKTLARTAPSYRLALSDYYLAQGRLRDAALAVESLDTDKSISNQVTLRLAAIRLAEGKPRPPTQ